VSESVYATRSDKAFRVIGKCSIFLTVLLALTALNVVLQRHTTWDGDFLVGWTCCLVFGWLRQDPAQ
jgi:hypothetical protein